MLYSSSINFIKSIKIAFTDPFVLFTILTQKIYIGQALFLFQNIRIKKQMTVNLLTWNLLHLDVICQDISK